MEKQTFVTKVTLSSGKVVLLKEMKIRHQELAIAAAAPKAGDNQALLAFNVQKELLKILVVNINGQDKKPIELEKLDDVFSMSEYLQLLKVMSKLMGDDSDMGKSQIEVVPFGDK